VAETKEEYRERSRCALRKMNRQGFEEFHCLRRKQESEDEFNFLFLRAGVC
jgi:hypothetical protein